MAGKTINSSFFDMGINKVEVKVFTVDENAKKKNHTTPGPMTMYNGIGCFQ